MRADNLVMQHRLAALRLPSDWLRSDIEAAIRRPFELAPALTEPFNMFDCPVITLSDQSTLVVGPLEHKFLFRPGQGITLKERTEQKLADGFLLVGSNARHLAEGLKHNPYFRRLPLFLSAARYQRPVWPSEFYKMRHELKDIYHNHIDPLILHLLLPWIAAFRKQYRRDPEILIPACSEGHLCASIRRQTGIHSHGIDVTRQFKKHWLLKRLRNMRIADACHLPFEDQSFDAVVASGIGTEHVNTTAETRLMLQEFYRVLRLYPNAQAGPHIGGLLMWTGWTRFVLPEPHHVTGPHTFLEPYFEVFNYSMQPLEGRQFVVAFKKSL